MREQQLSGTEPLRIRWAALLMAVVFAAGCDGYVTARFRVVSSDASAVQGAVVRLKDYGEYDHAQFTEEDGCGHLRGTISPFDRLVAVEVRKPGYQTLRLDVPAGFPDKCFVIALASQSGPGVSSFKAVKFDECPCGDGAGYPPTMSARFQVINADGAAVESVELREPSRGPLPWAHVTDSEGCIGVTWIVSADAESVSLVLEKDGYHSVGVEVPTMDDKCYTVSLSRLGATAASTIDATSEENCACEMFSGDTIWLEQ